MQAQGSPAVLEAVLGAAACSCSLLWLGAMLWGHTELLGFSVWQQLSRAPGLARPHIWEQPPAAPTLLQKRKKPPNFCK